MKPYPCKPMFIICIMLLIGCNFDLTEQEEFYVERFNVEMVKDQTFGELIISAESNYENLYLKLTGDNVDINSVVRMNSNSSILFSANVLFYPDTSLSSGNIQVELLTKVDQQFVDLEIEQIVEF